MYLRQACSSSRPWPLVTQSELTSISRSRTSVATPLERLECFYIITWIKPNDPLWISLGPSCLTRIWDKSRSGWVSRPNSCYRNGKFGSWCLHNHVSFRSKSPHVTISVYCLDENYSFIYGYLSARWWLYEPCAPMLYLSQALLDSVLSKR